MSFDKASLIQNKLDVVIEDMKSEGPQTLLDAVFPREQVEDSKFVITVMPAKTNLGRQRGKLADGAPARPQRAALAKVAGEITGRYEGSFEFTEAERRNLEGNNIQLARYAAIAREDMAFNIDADLHNVLMDGNHFQAHTRTGAAWTNVTAPIIDDLEAIKRKLGYRSDLIVICGLDVAASLRQLDAMKVRLSNYSAGALSEDELKAAFRGLGFADFITPTSVGDANNQGNPAVTLAYNFDGLFWVGRQESVYNVELGTEMATFERDGRHSSYLLKSERYLEIQPTLGESKLGGCFVTAPLG